VRVSAFSCPTKDRCVHDARLGRPVACPVLAVRENIPTYDEIRLFPEIRISIISSTPSRECTEMRSIPFPCRIFAYRSQPCVTQDPGQNFHAQCSLIVEADRVRFRAHGRNTCADEHGDSENTSNECVSHDDKGCLELQLLSEGKRWVEVGRERSSKQG
jgi:hypothetical protein